jgi:hypothetical protein
VAQSFTVQRADVPDAARPGRPRNPDIDDRVFDAAIETYAHTAIFLSILFSLAGTKIAQQYTKAATDPAYLAAAKANPGQVASLRQHLAGGLEDTSFLNGLAKPLVHPFFVGFSAAGDVVFAVTAVLLLAVIVLSACLKEVPLRLVSGNQARAQASESEATPAEPAWRPAPPATSARGEADPPRQAP